MLQLSQEANGRILYFTQAFEDYRLSFVRSLALVLELGQVRVVRHHILCPCHSKHLYGLVHSECDSLSNSLVVEKSVLNDLNQEEAEFKILSADCPRLFETDLVQGKHLHELPLALLLLFLLNVLFDLNNI